MEETEDVGVGSWVEVYWAGKGDWYLGKIDKSEFYQKARFYKEGDYDPDSPPRKSFYFRADCYNIPIRELNG